MLSDRVIELAEQYDTIVLADTVTHRALVALYVDLLRMGGSLSDEDIQDIINAFIREASTEPMMGLGWLYYACGQKTLGALPDQNADADEQDFNTLMVIFAINTIHGFPEGVEGQEALFEKAHEGIKASIELAGSGVVEAALDDLEDILVHASKEELASLCRDRGMSDEDFVATFDSLQAAFESGSGASRQVN